MGRRTISNMTVTMLWLLSAIVGSTAAGCKTVTISGSVSQSLREGAYKKTDTTCNGKGAYEQVGASYYLYYVITVDGWTGWMVGSTICENSGVIAVSSDADHPADVKENWEEVSATTSWTYNYALRVSCVGLGVGAIVGITIACVAVVVIIIIVACCCRKKKKSTLPHTAVSAQRAVPQAQTAVPQNPVSYVSTPATYESGQGAIVHAPVYVQGDVGNTYLANPRPPVDNYLEYGPPPAYNNLSAFVSGTGTGGPPGGAVVYPPMYEPNPLYNPDSHQNSKQCVET